MVCAYLATTPHQPLPSPFARRARDFLYGSLSFDKAVTVSFFEITIRLLGGLVSCYDLSADRMFLDKALDLGNRLLPYFGVSRSGRSRWAGLCGWGGFHAHQQLRCEGL